MNKFVKLASSGAAALIATVAIPMTAFAQLDYTYTNEISDDSAGAVLGGLGLCYCVGMFGGVVITALLAYWTYKDAKKRNNQNAVLWAVLVFFFTFVGLVVYLLTQRKDSVVATEQKTTTTTETTAPPAESKPVE